MDTKSVAIIHPPAKLNLFLELIARRDDGFHEIDTVMAAIDWRDKIVLRRTPDSSIRLQCDWSPSRAAFAQQLGLDASDSQLDLPADESNLVFRALREFLNEFKVAGGFDCVVEKQIPAGAGMGGASSDAASVLIAAAKLCGIDKTQTTLLQIAKKLGSDVPFFLGPTNQTDPVLLAQNDSSDDSFLVARAEGTGTRTTSFRVGYRPWLVCAFPPVCLSTKDVYQASKIPQSPQTAKVLIDAWLSDHPETFADRMLNRLAEPATKMVPQINTILDVMRWAGARGCQLTGSGSACFATANTRQAAEEIANQVVGQVPGILVRITTFCDVPAAALVTTSPDRLWR